MLLISTDSGEFKLVHKCEILLIANETIYLITFVYRIKSQFIFSTAHIQYTNKRVKV